MIVGKVAAFAASVGLLAGACAAPAAVVVETMLGVQPGHRAMVTGIVGNTGRVNESRIFLTQKNGFILSYDRTTATVSTFADLWSRTTHSSSNERGLLGLAFDPDYATNGHYYTYLTTPTAAGGAEAKVIRFTDPLIASGAEQTIWTMDLQGATNHLSGWIDFDTSGKLLIAIGDGGEAATPDVRNTGQNATDWFGSILRIDPRTDGFPSDSTLNYAIPTDNPLLGAATPNEVYIYGVRNPYRNTVTPDGYIIVADVGHNDREELTIVGPGDTNRNLGWPIREGDIATPGVAGALPADYQGPDLVYDHSEGFSIIGGFVYRGTAVPELAGHYVFGDLSGKVWAIRYQNGQFIGSKQLIGEIPSLVAFGELPDGELIATQFNYSGGAIFRLASDGTFPAVPEPATWASLIAGFALAGGAMRRRGRNPVLRYSRS